MNSFRFYDYMKKKYQKKYHVGELTREMMLEFLKQSSYSLKIRSGELFTFNCLVFVREMSEVLDQKPMGYIVDLTCGDLIVGEYDENGNICNYFLQELVKRSLRQDNISVRYRYNPLEAMEQPEYCYVHFFIVDDGKIVCLEEPHGYRTKDGHLYRKWMISEDNPEFAKDLLEIADSYDERFCSPLNDFSFFDNKIFTKADFFNRTKEYAFESENEYSILNKKWFENILANSKSVEL